MVKAAAEGPSPIQTNPLNRDAKNKGPYAARKDCIKRKTRELSILCGIAACTVIVSPNGEVDTWPENPTDVKSIIDRYKEHIDGPRWGKKSPRPYGFPVKISLNEFLSGWRDDWLRGLSRGVLGSFLGDLESKLRAMETRIDGLNETNYEQRNPQQGKSMVPHNYGYADPLPPLQEVHSADCVCCYHPVYVEPLNWYRPSDDEDDEACEDCTQQLFPMAAIHSQPLLLLDEGPIGFEDVNPVQPVAPPVVEGSLNGYYGDLDEVDENSSNYCRQFFPLNG